MGTLFNLSSPRFEDPFRLVSRTDQVRGFPDPDHGFPDPDRASEIFLSAAPACMRRHLDSASAFARRCRGGRGSESGLTLSSLGCGEVQAADTGPRRSVFVFHGAKAD